MVHPHCLFLIDDFISYFRKKKEIVSLLKIHYQTYTLIRNYIHFLICIILGFSGDSDGKELPAMWETWVQSLGWEDPLEKRTATHSSILAWRIPWTEEPGRLQPMELQRVRQD